MTRILITGSRSWRCPDIARRVLTAIRAKIGDGFVVVHGDATGVDRSFREVCEELGIQHEPHPAKWDVTGPSAGPIRNSKMVRLGAAYCVAVHRNIAWSKGTADCARKCLNAGIAVYLIDGVNPTRRLRKEDLERGK